MKKVLIGVLVVSLIAGGGFAVYKFSGPRGEVGKEKILKQLDNWLGEAEVREKEVNAGIRDMEEGIGKLTEARVKAQIQADVLEKEVKGNKRKIDESRDALSRLRNDLTAFDTDTKYAVIYGKQKITSKAELDKLAAQVIAAHKTLATQTDSMEKRLEAYQLTAATLAKREEEAKKKLADMKTTVLELEAEMKMVKAQREAAAVLNENDKSFADGVKSLQKKVDDLSLDAKTKTALEKLKWDELVAREKVDDATQLLTESKSTVNEIDDLLGKK